MGSGKNLKIYGKGDKGSSKQSAWEEPAEWSGD
jgi:hypothetical protein